MKKIKTIGIIGLGAFGKLMHKYLVEHFDVRTYDLNDSDAQHKIVCESDVVIFAVPVQLLDVAAQKAQPFVPPHTIVADVSSVKIRPLEVLQKYFPNNQILGTHPIFGPQTEEKLGGIKGLPIVLTNVSLDNEDYTRVKDFLSTKLELEVIEKTAESHDKEVALVMGISHFIGRALANMGIKHSDIETHGYSQLVSLAEIVGPDSFELFKAIQTENPYAKEKRDLFLGELHKLEDKLSI